MTITEINYMYNKVSDNIPCTVLYLCRSSIAANVVFIDRPSVDVNNDAAEE